MAIAVLAATACGGRELTTTPTRFAPRMLTIVSGTTGAPVAGARANVGGRALTTDGAGRLFVDGVPPGSALDLSAPGYLARETQISETDAPVTLWPLQAATSDYVRALVYTDSQATRDQSAGPAEPLIRVVAARVSIVPSDEILSDRRARATHEAAVDEINAAAGGRVIVSLDEAPGAAVVFRAATDAAASSGAITYRDLRDDAIVGGRILYGDLSVARDIRYVAHELGHVLGLQHSTKASDMMYYVALDGSPAAFAPAELATIAMLLQRRPGTLYPDNDRGAASAGAVRRTSIAVN